MTLVYVWTNTETRRWLPRDKSNDTLALSPPPPSNKNNTDNGKGKKNAQDVIVRKDKSSERSLSDPYLSDTMIWPGECEFGLVWLVA